MSIKITLAATTVSLVDDWELWSAEEPPLGGTVGFEGESSNLAEFGGRSCYQSWSKPNPATATNEGYLANIISQGHFSVMEHGSTSFYVEDVSRALTHELIRHRHHSYSQLSQRFVKIKDGTGPVVPPLFRGDQETEQMLQAAWDDAVALYDRLVALWEPRVRNQGVDAHRARKATREAARAVLPNMTPTAILVTGNHRAWRELLEKRGSIHADAEIREFALAIFAHLNELEPNLYQDFTIERQDGVEVLVRR